MAYPAGAQIESPSRPAEASSAMDVRPPDLVERFRVVARQRATATAVEAGDGTLTYAELERLSNQLAHRLRGLGVGRDARVGVSMPRGARELVALLATLKAGGAYVPLDPSHPLDRLMAIVEDAAPQVMLTHPESPLCSGFGAGAPLLLIDDLAAITADQDPTPPPVSYDSAQLCYILFTSGSTGRPKGVEISRGAFANFLSSMAHTPGLGAHERLLAITTTSFDIAGLELFLPLWVGATTVIVDRDTARDPRALRRQLEAGTISVMQATPATWRLLLEAGWRGDEKLRMFCGGEALSPELANRLLACGAELWNLYGPTETTVWSSLERVLPGYDRITIGRPIDRTQMYVLDDKLARLPNRQEGEIWIGGDGLARGYHRRPELTSERFVQNPYGPPGDLIYRTGDLGRQLEDGRFECLGRLDHQVKISGFRIELGEIETVLRAVPGVAEALVVADQRHEVAPRLLAYWVGTAERETLIKEARRKLPPYMVPAAFACLQAFALNTNGKIDRKRLPQPEAINQRHLPPERPRTEIEMRIANIWKFVLGQPEVRTDQDFFTLGGTSALAAQVVAHMRMEFGTELPLQAFFEAPTVQGLAARVGRTFSPDDPITVHLREGAATQAPLWCLFGVAIYYDLALALPGDQPVMALHVPFRYVPGRDRQPEIQEVARRYVELIRRHQPHGPYQLLGLCFGGIVAHEVARQLEAAHEKIAMVTILDAILPTAVHVDQLERVRGRMRQLLEDPRQLRPVLSKTNKKLIARVPGLRTVLPRAWAPQSGSVAPGVAIDLPVDGPEVDAAVARFAARPERLHAHLLIIRATQEAVPPWKRIDPDHGWGGRADHVVVRDIQARHLQLLQLPNVRSLARAIAEQQAESTLT